MLVLNSIERNAMDLQTAEVETELTNFHYFLQKKDMSVSYDYEGRGFKMVSNGAVNDKITKTAIHLRSQGVEKVDHPFLRQTLYFDELKNIDQIVKIKYPKNAPSKQTDLPRVHKGHLPPERLKPDAGQREPSRAASQSPSSLADPATKRPLRHLTLLPLWKRTSPLPLDQHKIDPDAEGGDRCLGSISYQKRLHARWVQHSSSCAGHCLRCV